MFFPAAAFLFLLGRIRATQSHAPGSIPLTLRTQPRGFRGDAPPCYLAAVALLDRFRRRASPSVGPTLGLSPTPPVETKTCLVCTRARSLDQFTDTDDIGAAVEFLLTRDADGRRQISGRPVRDICDACRVTCHDCGHARDPADFTQWDPSGFPDPAAFVRATHRCERCRDWFTCDDCARLLPSSWFLYVDYIIHHRPRPADAPPAFCDDCHFARDPRWWHWFAALTLAEYRAWFETLTGPFPPPPAPPLTLGAADDGRAITLTPSVRNRHLYIIGKTGSGKSSLLRNLIMQDLDAGRGVIFLDPHGDTAQQLLGYVPDHRRDDVTYFCPTDPQAPAFNLLASPYPADKLTRDMVSAIKMFFGDSWGPRLNQLLTNALATLLLDRGHEAHTLADLETLLLDAGYRADVVARCQQPRLQAFWQAQFPTMSKDAVNPVLNKLADLLMPTSPLERIFSTRTNSLDLTATMDGGRILLCNLSKGELGDAAAFLLGGLIVTAVAQAALARATQPEAERRDVFLYVDEFQNFAIDSFQTILSEARKYRLNLTLAHQYLHQVPADLQAAIFGNVAVVAAFATSAADGAIMRREMAHPVTTVTGDNAEAIAAAEERNRRAHARARETAQRDYFNSSASALDRPHFDLDRRAADLASDHLKPVPEYAAHTTEDLWPEARDFLTLQPLHGFVKIGTVDTTQRFSISHPTAPPDPNRAAAIIAHQRAQHVAPQLDDAAASSPPPPPPRDPGDFAF